MIRIQKIAPDLIRNEEGIWVSRGRTELSYPQDGNEACFGIEEDSFWFNNRNRIILETVQLFPPGGEIFDIGGGNGFISLTLKQAGFSTVLVEPGEAGVKNARERGMAPIIQSTLEEAGFKEHSLPGVGLFDVLEHIEKDDVFLKNIRRLLVDNGRLYITVPTYTMLWSAADDDAGHYRRYTIQSLDETLKHAGFQIEYASYFFGLLVAPIFLFRSIPSRLGIRKRKAISKYRKELVLTNSWLEWIIRWVVRMEANIIRRRKSIPFGSSCLVVAKARPSYAGAME
jgi:2-polyprenyl-3-methyl-5-hydroxy-6-metoxy-1,4-benzoquinol methylase